MPTVINTVQEWRMMMAKNVVNDGYNWWFLWAYGISHIHSINGVSSVLILVTGILGHNCVYSLWIFTTHCKVNQHHQPNLAFIRGLTYSMWRTGCWACWFPGWRCDLDPLWCFDPTWKGTPIAWFLCQTLSEFASCCLSLTPNISNSSIGWVIFRDKRSFLANVTMLPAITSHSKLMCWQVIWTAVQVCCLISCVNFHLKLT